MQTQSFTNALLFHPKDDLSFRWNMFKKYSSLYRIQLYKSNLEELNLLNLSRHVTDKDMLDADGFFVMDTIKNY